MTYAEALLPESEHNERLGKRVRITKPSEVPGAVVLSLTTPASWEDFQGFLKAVEALQGDGFVVRSVESSYKLFRVWLRREEE
ncbi:hypothetical protein [Thermococcus sp. 9N3]|uniref:hypothetical protein n=1 Tax=Thermococcus sp. 9N3 TaxID=163002 RepID=UPI0014307111|nr:hypothetical protein [Thermococcus sp. 9N3]NJE48395.1 hypothetical protein [Thermococcus sp. 9N3]